jgi:RimJ/RimL family protein N-acetyltransferase
MIPVVETPRLILRAPEAGDVGPLADFLTSERSRALGGPFPRHEVWSKLAAHAGQWLLRGYGSWMIADRATGRALGRVGVYHPEGWLEPELGWALFGEAEGKGIAFEAATAARAEARRRCGFERLISTIDAANARSLALARRLGCVFEGDWLSPYGPLGVWRHPAEAAA